MASTSHRDRTPSPPHSSPTRLRSTSLPSSPGPPVDLPGPRSAAPPFTHASSTSTSASASSDTQTAFVDVPLDSTTTPSTSVDMSPHTVLREKKKESPVSARFSPSSSMPVSSRSSPSSSSPSTPRPTVPRARSRATLSLPSVRNDPFLRQYPPTGEHILSNRRVVVNPLLTVDGSAWILHGTISLATVADRIPPPLYPVRAWNGLGIAALWIADHRATSIGGHMQEAFFAVMVSRSPIPLPWTGPLTPVAGALHKDVLWSIESAVVNNDDYRRFLKELHGINARQGRLAFHERIQSDGRCEHEILVEEGTQSILRLRTSPHDEGMRRRLHTTVGMFRAMGIVPTILQLWRDTLVTRFVVPEHGSERERCLDMHALRPNPLLHEYNQGKDILQLGDAHPMAHLIYSVGFQPTAVQQWDGFKCAVPLFSKRR